jgi:very-short-patch-repair endonuclease
MTPAESVLWHNLRRNALSGFHFRRQQIIEGYIVDFYCHQVAVAIECDGAGHEATYDAARDATLQARGIKTLRFHNDEVLNNTPEVLRKIKQVLEERK